MPRLVGFHLKKCFKIEEEEQCRDRSKAGGAGVLC